MSNEVLISFRRFIKENVAIPIAAMNCLIEVISKSKASTWMGLEQDLRAAISQLKKCKHEVVKRFLIRICIDIKFIGFRRKN
jgi:translation initiation factor 2B subunit (eIF-2B alpha/beta/delta family)